MGARTPGLPYKPSRPASIPLCSQFGAFAGQTSLNPGRMGTLAAAPAIAGDDSAVLPAGKSSHSSTNSHRRIFCSRGLGIVGIPWPIRTLSLWTGVGIDLPARACNSHAARGFAAVSPYSELCCQFPLLSTVVVVVVTVVVMSGIAVMSGNVGTNVGITPTGDAA